mgnify:CR=1 FL=1
MSASLYGTWFDDENYVSLTFGYGYHSYDSVRDLIFAAPPLEAKGDFSGHTFTIAPEVGKLFRWDEMELEPFATLDYTHFRHQSYDEDGAGGAGLSVNDDTEDSICTELGVRFRSDFDLENGGRLMPELRLSWLHDFSDEVVNTARFAGANTSFQTTGIDVVEDIFNIGLGVNWQFDDSKVFYTHYDAELGSGFDGHTLQAGIKVLF